MSGVPIRIIVLGLAAVLGANAGPQAPVARLLDRYLRGHYEEAVSAAAVQDPAELATAFGREASGWVRAAGSEDDVVRRRFAAATFALEVAYAAHPPADPSYDPDWWYAKVLIEHACQLVREAREVHPLERTWFLASIVLAKGAYDDEFLVGKPLRVASVDRSLMTADTSSPPSGLQYLGSAFGRPDSQQRRFGARSGVALDRHLADALGRVDDGRIRLAGATDTDFPATFVRGLMMGQGPGVANVRLERPLGKVAALRDRTDIRPDVSLLLGFAALIKGQVDAALPLLAGVEGATDDPFLRYLSGFFLGWTFERSGRPDDAVRHYRQAVAWRPYPSASLPLAALLLGRAEHDEAIALTEAMLALEDPEEDPLVRFGRGDSYRWAEYIAELRKRIPMTARPARRSILVLVVVVVAGVVADAMAPLAAGRADQRQRPTFRSAVDGVTVAVSVRSGDRPVDALTLSDFALSDNGVVQTIESVTTESVPLDVTVVVDTSGSTQGDLEDFRRRVREMVALLGPRDRLRLLTCSDVVRQIFPLRYAAEIDPARLDAVATEFSSGVRNGLAGAIIARDEPGRRRLAVLFTDGRDNFSSVPPPSLIEVVRHSDVTIHIGGGAGDRVFGEVAQLSGGRVHRTSRMVRVLQDVLDEARGSYVLRYMPAGVTSEGWHELDVRVTRPGRHEVTARRGYVGR